MRTFKIIAQVYFILISLPGVGFCQNFDPPPYFGEASREKLDIIETTIRNLDIVEGIIGVNTIFNIANNAVVRPSEDFESTVQDARDHVNDAKDDEELQNAIDAINGINDMQRARVNGEIELLLGDTEAHLNQDEINFWENFKEMFNRNNGNNAATANSVGDPHLQTFDRLKYDFQTVGEFTLCEAPIRKFAVQVRQKAINNNSKNTAVAVNLHGNIIAIYVEDFPDNDNAKKIQVNNITVETKKLPLYFKQGGKLEYIDKTFKITWFTGEQVAIKDMTSWLDVFITVPYSSFSIYEGLLGNYNNKQDDDLKIKGGKKIEVYKNYFENITLFNGTALAKPTDKAIKKYQKTLNEDFGNSWRITDSNSFFKYANGKNTLSFTDKDFPKNKEGVSNIREEDKSIARKKCEDAGVKSEAMRQCIYDYTLTKDDGYINSAVIVSDVSKFLTSLNIKEIIKIPTTDELKNKANDKIKKEVLKVIKF